MWLQRLPPDYRRRYYTNLAILAALIIVVTNLWRLGKHNATTAVLVVMCLAFGYACVFPAVKLLRARPRPGVGAFVLAGTYLAAVIYAAASVALPLPASGLALVLGIVLLWVFMIVYRGIVFSGLFDRNGRFGERFRTVRAAQRASRIDVDDLKF
ncbi:MAG: hypothetical protein ACREM8_04850 [Vulcanimicrobiaceae bacterium]